MLHIWWHSLCHDIIMLTAFATLLSPIDTSKMKLIRKQDQPVFFVCGLQWLHLYSEMLI